MRTPHDFKYKPGQFEISIFDNTCYFVDGNLSVPLIDFFMDYLRKHDLDINCLIVLDKDLNPIEYEWQPGNYIITIIIQSIPLESESGKNQIDEVLTHDTISIVDIITLNKEDTQYVEK